MPSLRLWLVVLAACTRAREPSPAPTAAPASTEAPASTRAPAPAPAPGVAPTRAPAPAVAPAVTPRLAIDAPGPRAPETGGAHFGVRWRVAVPRSAEYAPSTASVVVGDEVFLGAWKDRIEVLDRATGAKRRTAPIAHTRLLAAGTSLVVTTANEVIGLDKDKLVPRWRISSNDDVHVIGDGILEVQKQGGEQRIRLRRAADGQVAWEIRDRFRSLGVSGAVLAGDTIYVQLELGRVGALDLATGAIRWETSGTLRSASRRHVAIVHPSTDPTNETIDILDPSGRTQWRAEGVRNVLLHEDTAYVTTKAALIAIDLAGNTVVWRRDQATASALSDAWVYGVSETSLLTVLDRATGALAGRVPLEHADLLPARLEDAPVFTFMDRWLFGLGPLASPEPAALRDARGCLVVHGCGGNSAPVIGATVTIAGAKATTDQRGCFSVRARLGLGPVAIDVAGGKVGRLDRRHFDIPLPTAEVFAGPPVTLTTEWIGGGCHDSRPGSFP